MRNPTSRRTFLRTAPLAVASVTLPSKGAVGQSPAPRPSEPFKFVPASEFAEALSGMKAKPGNFNFYDVAAMPFTAVLTVEERRAAQEFEWHEGRDHLLQVVDGSTVYEVGGTPEHAHNTKPGEWLAPACTGATTLRLKQGDWLILPRGTPHKRTTEERVTFYLISTTGR